MKQSFDSSPVQTCPRCQSDARRKFHSVPIVFKGSGWYVNDYGKRGSKSTSSSESKDPSSADSKPENKADSASKSQSNAESKTAKAKSD
jgi:predicted nucleic acid-binding Zn ribbon protein